MVRWFIERTISWFHQFRRLRIRWERQPEMHQVFLSLAADGHLLPNLDQRNLVLSPGSISIQGNTLSQNYVPFDTPSNGT